MFKFLPNKFFFVCGKAVLFTLGEFKGSKRSNSSSFWGTSSQGPSCWSTGAQHFSHATNGRMKDGHTSRPGNKPRLFCLTLTEQEERTQFQDTPFFFFLGKRILMKAGISHFYYSYRHFLKVYYSPSITKCFSCGKLAQNILQACLHFQPVVG